MTRQRISFMISKELNEALERIYQAEISKANQEGISPLPKSRVYERLLSRGLVSYPKEQEVKE